VQDGLEGRILKDVVPADFKKACDSMKKM